MHHALNSSSHLKICSLDSTNGHENQWTWSSVEYYVSGCIPASLCLHRYKAQRRHVLASINDELIWERTGQTKTNMDCTGTVCPATPISHYSIYSLLTCPGQTSMTDIFWPTNAYSIPHQFNVDTTFLCTFWRMRFIFFLNSHSFGAFMGLQP